MDHTLQRAGPITRFEPLVTAHEAYPALEREFLCARQDIHAAFRLFDLTTRLRSDAARAVGETWFDLVLHTLDRGVTVHLTVSDFDPIGAAPLHRECWRTCRHAAALRESSRNPTALHFHVSRHSARVGALPRMVLGPLAWLRLRMVARRLSDRPARERISFLAEAPDIRAMTRVPKDKVVLRLILPQLWTTTHHHKIAVFDRTRLYVGGLDLNDRRYDSQAHDQPSDGTWHDVQALVEGPAVAAAQAHLESFQAVTEGRAAPAPAAPGFLRTLSTHAGRTTTLSPRRLVDEIERWHRDAIAGAQRLIYLETQFLRDLKLARALADRGRALPGLGLILILPGAPEDVAFEANTDRAARYGEWLQARALRLLRRGFGPDRLVVASPVQSRRAQDRGRATLHGAPIIYVHAKVSVFDGARAAVSSANLNGRSLRWDTEAGICLDDPAMVDDLRRRCMAHWLPEGADPAMLEPDTALPLWRDLIRRNAGRRPEDRAGFLVPHDATPSEAFGKPLPGVPPEAV
jgi:phospholipase D1/2